MAACSQHAMRRRHGRQTRCQRVVAVVADVASYVVGGETGNSNVIDSRNNRNLYVVSRNSSQILPKHTLMFAEHLAKYMIDNAVLDLMHTG